MVEKDYAPDHPDFYVVEKEYEPDFPESFAVKKEAEPGPGHPWQDYHVPDDHYYDHHEPPKHRAYDDTYDVEDEPFGLHLGGHVWKPEVHYEPVTEEEWSEF